MEQGDLLLRNVEIEGHPFLDARLRNGRIVETGEHLGPGGTEIDGRGGALLPGLIDHHTHLFALAAESASIRLTSQSAGGLERALRARHVALPPDVWLRVVGYEDLGQALLDRHALDRILGDRPVRVQHCSGSLWILNSLALNRVRVDDDTASCVERDGRGNPTGRLWRADDWLRARLAAEPPSLAPISASLAALGVTGVTDASVTNDRAQAAIFARAVRAGELRQRLFLMSDGALEAPGDRAFRVGPVKILLDEGALPDLGHAVVVMSEAHRSGRAVAVHCVTAGELAFTLAAFTEAGTIDGDRIEHGGVIHPYAAEAIARLGLAVVTQPGFVFENGDRYLADVDPDDMPYLYPCGSLIRAGIKVAGSSDAPYASSNPWLAMAAAVRRTTRAGRRLGADEQIAPARALSLFLGDFADPGGPPRRVRVGAPADLCLLDRPVGDALNAFDSDLVAATIVDGRVIYQRD